jgi:hypothetical protein
MPLATVEDVVARLGRPISDDAEAAKIAAFIDDATGLVRDYCGTDFQRHTDETFEVLVEGGKAALVSSLFPDLSISAVILHEQQGDTVLAAGEWRMIRRRLHFRSALDYYSSATVTASWGWSAVPPAVKAAICSEVIRWLSVSPGTVMEKTGDLEVQYAQTAYNSGLSEAAKSMLFKYRPRLASARLTPQD